MGSMATTIDQALSTLYAVRSVTLQGRPAAWSNTSKVLFYVLMGMVALLALGAVVGLPIAIAAGVEVTVFTFLGLFGFLGMMTALMFLLRRGMRSQSRYRDQEAEEVILSGNGLTLRGVGPIPWEDFGPAERRMVPAEHDSGRVRRAVMELTPSGRFNVNERLAPELRSRISPAIGPIWNRHHRYVYVSAVEGLTQDEVIQLINTAREMFGPHAARG